MAGLNNDQNPILSQTRIGPQYLQLVPGPPGPIGPAGGVVTTTANFTQPAVGSTVLVSLTTSAGLFSGLIVAVQSGGFYQVTAVNSGTTATLQNLGLAGNTIPGGSIGNGSILSGSGPTNLLVQSNGAGITQRAILDLEGLTYADDAPGGRMKFTQSTIATPAPGATITGAGTTTSAQWNLFQSASSPYSITIGTIVPGLPYFYWNISGGTSNISINPVTLFRGSNSFTIEDPQNTLSAPANSVLMQVPGQRFNFMLDATNNVLRCMGPVQ